jgi:hypothetical protein
MKTTEAVAASMHRIAGRTPHDRERNAIREALYHQSTVEDIADTYIGRYGQAQVQDKLVRLLCIELLFGVRQDIVDQMRTDRNAIDRHFRSSGVKVVDVADIQAGKGRRPTLVVCDDVEGVER